MYNRYNIKTGHNYRVLDSDPPSSDTFFFYYFSHDTKVQGDLIFCLRDIASVKKSIKNALRRIKDLVEFRKVTLNYSKRMQEGYQIPLSQKYFLGCKEEPHDDARAC